MDAVFPLRPEDLSHLRRHVALLVERLENSCASTTDPEVRRTLEITTAQAHSLLDKMTLAEQAVTAQGTSSAAMQRFHERLQRAEERFDAMHERRHPSP